MKFAEIRQIFLYPTNFYPTAKKFNFYPTNFTNFFLEFNQRFNNNKILFVFNICVYLIFVTHLYWNICKPANLMGHDELVAIFFLHFYSTSIKLDIMPNISQIFLFLPDCWCKFRTMKKYLFSSFLRYFADWVFFLSFIQALLNIPNYHIYISRNFGH